MDNQPEIPAELEPVIAELMTTAGDDPLLTRLPVTRLETELRAAVAASAQPMAELLEAIGKANAERAEALRELTTNPSDAATAMVGRAAMQAEGARLGLAELKRVVLERTRWAHTADVLASRGRAAEHVARLAGPKGLLDTQVQAAKALDDALEALRSAADAYLATHDAACKTARDFAAAAIQRFEPPHPLWKFERRDDVVRPVDVARHEVMEMVLYRLDETFRPWGNAWTSSVALRYVSRGGTLGEAQRERNAKVHGVLYGAAREFGVEAPGHA